MRKFSCFKTYAFSLQIAGWCNSSLEMSPHTHTHMHIHMHTHTHIPTQVMVNSEVSGVAFSRHPLTPLSSNTVLVEAVFGLGEGFVSGELEVDRYEVINKLKLYM